jgi:hypothetical protein
MNNTQPTDSIEPSMFEVVEQYAAELASGEKTIYQTINKDNGLLDFCETFLTQFSSFYMKKPAYGFNDRSQSQLSRARLHLEGKPGTEEAQRLIYALEPLCTRIPEIKYGRSEIESDQFHGEFIPDLLRQILLWLEEIDASPDLQEAASSAETAYLEAVGLD